MYVENKSNEMQNKRKKMDVKNDDYSIIILALVKSYIGLITCDAFTYFIKTNKIKSEYKLTCI